MNKAFIEEYYDTKYGEDIEIWMEDNEKFQRVEEEKNKLEDAFYDAIGGSTSENAAMYDAITVLWFEYARTAMKEMYMRGAEEREKMLEI